MKERKEIKVIGRENFKAAYWPGIGAMVLAMLPIFILGFFSGILGESGDSNLVLFLISLISIANFLIQGPLMIGLNNYYIQRSYGREDVTATDVYADAFTGYGRKLGGYFLMNLFIGLWSILLIVPGIIKTYAYALTPYILADCPTLMVCTFCTDLRE